MCSHRKYDMRYNDKRSNNHKHRDQDDKAKSRRSDKRREAQGVRRLIDSYNQ